MEFHKRRPQKSLNPTVNAIKGRAPSSSSISNNNNNYATDINSMRPVLDPQLSVVSNPDMSSIDMDEDQAQDLAMTSLRTSQSECDLRELRTSQSSETVSELSPTATSVIQQPSYGMLDNSSAHLTQESPSDITAKLEPRISSSSAASAALRLNNNFAAGLANSVSSVSHMDTSNDYSIRPPSSTVRALDQDNVDHQRPGSRQRAENDHVWADSKSRDVWNSSPQPSPQSNDRENQTSSSVWGEHAMMKQEIQSEAGAE